MRPAAKPMRARPVATSRDFRGPVTECVYLPRVAREAVSCRPTGALRLPVSAALVGAGTAVARQTTRQESNALDLLNACLTNGGGPGGSTIARPVPSAGRPPGAIRRQVPAASESPGSCAPFPT